MLGLPKGKVFLVAWDEEWEKEFSIEKDKILKLIENYIISCHHIGSTAVKGLSSKPIIDIAIELKHYEDGFSCIDNLLTIGYKHRIIPELPDRHYFSKGEPRTHQIHMYQVGSIYFKKQIIFRDCLIENVEIRNEYHRIKKKYATEHSTDKLTYADAKTEFINGVLKKYGL
jgi:GrpB-like predicted nucleotidyltransferase (UPF0157 family)